MPDPVHAWAAVAPDRKTITDLYVRICRDSGYQFEYIRAAHFVADMLKIGVFEVCNAMGGFDTMQRVADGSHPACVVPVKIVPMERTDG